MLSFTPCRPPPGPPDKGFGLPQTPGAVTCKMVGAGQFDGPAARILRADPSRVKAALNEYPAVMLGVGAGPQAFQRR